jgi:hypothetical protein
VPLLPHNVNGHAPVGLEVLVLVAEERITAD